MGTSANDQVNVEITGSAGKLQSTMNEAAKAVDTSVQSINKSLSTLSQKSSSAFDSVGESSTKVERKLEHLSVAVGFSIGQLASSTGSATERILHALTGLGFALGPTAGIITLAVSAIGLAFVEDAKQAEEAQKKMSESLLKMREQMKGPALSEQIAALERYKKALEEGGKGTTRVGSQGQTLTTGADTAEEAEARQKNLIATEAQLVVLRQVAVEEARTAQIAQNKHEEEYDFHLRVETFQPNTKKAHEDEEKSLKAQKAWIDDLIDSQLKGALAWEEWNRKGDEQLKLDKELEATVKSIAATIKNMKIPDMGAWDPKERAKFEKQWVSVFDSIPDHAKRAFQDVIRSGQSFKAFWRMLVSEMALSFAGGVWHMVSVWAAGEVAKIAVTHFSVAQRVAAEKYGAVATLGIALWEGLKWIAIQAAKAAAAAWAAMAKYDPIITAPIVAGVTFAAVLALGATLKSAAGGFDIPAGMNPVTQLHAQEMVLPKEYAEVIRGMAGGGGGGAAGPAQPIIIYAMDSQDVARALAKAPNAVARHAAQGFSNGVSMPKSAGRNR